jgi:acetamidase/formamidase
VTASLEVVTVAPAADRLRYTFGGGEPLVTVAPGSVVELTTEDCFGGRVRGVGDLPSQVCEFPYLNPVTGPIAVEGAEPGDTLAVHLVEIAPARDWAVSSTFPHFGALTTTHSTAMLHEALEERVWVYEVDRERGTCLFRPHRGGPEVELPLDPMHGTIGGARGGNMDTPEARAGTTLYFGVNAPGGLLSIGDGHCRQGEGEVCGTAVEAAMRTVVVVDLVKGGAPAWPRLETDQHLMSTGSVRPLEDAFRISQHDLVTWAAELTGWDTLDALQLVSQAGLAPAGNVVDTNYTMVAKLPKRFLPGAVAVDGVHDRLRETAGAYLAQR